MVKTRFDKNKKGETKRWEVSMSDNDLHPVRFTNKQVGLIKHIMGHFIDYFEEESEEFFKTIKDSENVKTTERLDTE